MIDKKLITDRFTRYIKVHSESDPESQTTPSHPRLWNMARLLTEELKAIGLNEVTIDDQGYVMATLPSNIEHKAPVIGFIAHYDTSPDFTGKNIQPQVHHEYDGKDIILNEEQGIILSTSEFENLKKYKGHTLITTDGTTLLSADDKAGVTEIITAMEYLIQHPEIKHGTIKIALTPDEEIGRGAHHFDVSQFGADWAYTVDGSEIGELEYENFNAAEAIVSIKGKIVHPGLAKGKMINSMYIAQEFISSLPKMETPEHTSGREGFFHLCDMRGDVDQTTLSYIIRDHDRTHFEARKQMMFQITNDLNQGYGKKLISLEIKDQYYNMKEKIEPVMHIITLAKEAMEAVGVTPIIKPIRGGTDGSQLSFMGLPCPNIFAGGHNFHSRYEYVPVESMLKATEVIITIAELNAKNASSI